MSIYTLPHKDQEGVQPSPWRAGARLSLLAVPKCLTEAREGRRPGRCTRKEAWQPSRHQVFDAQRRTCTTEPGGGRCASCRARLPPTPTRQQSRQVQIPGPTIPAQFRKGYLAMRSCIHEIVRQPLAAIAPGALGMRIPLVHLLGCNSSSRSR